MAAAKRSLSSSSSSHPNHHTSVKRPRLVAEEAPQTNGGFWSGIAFVKNSVNRMLGRKPLREGPHVRRTNGSTSSVGLRLNISRNGGVIPALNGQASNEVLVLSDDEEDISIDYEREERRQQQATEALKHLNDHTRTLGGGATPQSIHPLLAQPLFTSSFDTPNTPSDSAPPSPEPTRRSKPSNRPDVEYSRPRRDYRFVRSRSSSSNLSNTSPSSSPPRSPRKTPNSYRNRSRKDLAAQLATLDRMIREDPEHSAPMRRVRDELLRKRPELQGAASTSSADISSIFKSLKLDHRRTFDEAVEARREEFQVPPQPRRRDRIQPAPFHQVKSSVLEKIKRDEEETEKAIRARLRPRVPKDVTPEQNEIVRQRLADPMFKSDTVDAKALRTLKPGTWLNDEIINFYVDALRARADKQGKKIAVGNSFFYQKLSEQGYAGVKRWGRTRKIPEKDLFIIPVHVQGCHWTCACINFKKKRIEYYDSMADHGFRYNVFENLRTYLKEEWKTRLDKEFDFTGWQDVYSSKTPQQNNGSDCGVFACQTMEALARGKDLTVKDQFEFSAADMPFFRKLMIVEIASGELASRAWA